MAMHKYVGRMLMATALLHTVVGLIFLRHPLGAIVKAGIFSSVTSYPERETAFWFILFGLVLLILGQLIHWVQMRYDTLPASLGWSLLALGVSGVILMPDSGFWLVLPQAYLLLRSRTATLLPKATRSESEHAVAD